jgi:hypothetical protein
VSDHHHFDKEQLGWLEDALLIGLSEHGECERIRDYIETLKLCEKSFDRQFLPAHPTGTSDIIGRFSSVLSLVRLAREEEEKTSAEASS